MIYLRVFRPFSYFLHCNNWVWRVVDEVLSRKNRERCGSVVECLTQPSSHGLEPHQRACVVSLSKNINPSLVLVQPRKTRPYITERYWWDVKNQIKQKSWIAILLVLLHPDSVFIRDHRQVRPLRLSERGLEDLLKWDPTSKLSYWYLASSKYMETYYCFLAFVLNPILHNHAFWCLWNIMYSENIMENGAFAPKEPIE